jgi:hypothetical protein
MGIGVSVFLIAVGAIMTFALNVESDGINLDTVGLILMGVGILGLLFTLLVLNSPSRREERTVVRERDREIL